MAQLGIREFDAKSMWYEHIGQDYQAYLVDKSTDLESLGFESTKRRVVKPDQLFGKRGKHGLLGINLDTKEIKQWIKQHRGKHINIDGVGDQLTTFIVEPFVQHEYEYYVSFQTTRDADIVNFSLTGGVEVEDNREQVSQLRIGLLDESNGIQWEKLLEKHKSDLSEKDYGLITDLLARLYSFFKDYGLVYLECNPFTIVNGKIVILDMVAKVDSCAHMRMRDNRKHISRVKPFGTHTDPVEAQVQDMDEKTMSSLKLHVLNPNGRIWMILGGGGASVIMVDTLAELGFAKEVANYGELSGNPDTDSNRAYSHLLVKQMLASNASDKYLIVAGGIANFTYIDSLMTGVCDALVYFKDEIIKQGVKVLVRRGGLHDKEGLAMIKNTCDSIGIPIQTADGDIYMTDILGNI